MPYTHLTGIHDLTVEQLREVLSLSAQMKARRHGYRDALPHKTLAMIFQKPSTRTRVSFEVGIHELGGKSLVLQQNELQLGRGETVADTARVLSRYVDGIMARVFAHDDILQLAAHASVPVINGLSDLLHPCQGICDYFTMIERFGDIAGLKVAYLGDGNNVAHSLAYGAARLGVHLVLATPDDQRYQPHAQVLERARAEGEQTGARIEVVHDPNQAVKGAGVVYTDVWTSMGQEAENERRRQALGRFQVDLALFEAADSKAIFMHCLPAHRGDEVTDEVADHERSVIFDQAENRLHTQKAILKLLMSSPA